MCCLVTLGQFGVSTLNFFLSIPTDPSLPPLPFRVLFIVVLVTCETLSKHRPD